MFTYINWNVFYKNYTRNQTFSSANSTYSNSAIYPTICTELLVGERLAYGFLIVDAFLGIGVREQNHISNPANIGYDNIWSSPIPTPQIGLNIGAAIK